MNLSTALSSDKPVVTILTVVVVAIAVIVGGIVTITNPQSLTFAQYLRDIALLGAGLGLGNGIGRGIETTGQSVPGAQPAEPAAPLDDR